MNLNDKKIKELYKAHAEQNAPDMDALWERIERGLDEKNTDTVSGVTSKPVRKHIGLGKIAVPAALAAVIALVIVPAAFRGTNSSNMAYDSGNSIMNEECELAGGAEEISENDENGSLDEGFLDGGEIAEDISEGESVLTGTVRYEDLKLESSGEYDEAEEAAPSYDGSEADPSVKTSGDDFFVEANVLIHTDVIVNAYVDRVYSRGETVCYELTAENADTRETENITLESATPYRLLENRSYVLPLKFDGGTYSLVFENAPQIEVSLDGGLIFHNGWVTLDSGDSADVIYPQNGIDDFFYDRMKFSYSADTDILVKKWHELKGDDLL